MDRALKERLIGAIVLVVVAVLVVPVFLDGPSSDDEIVTEQVTLPGQNDQPRMQQTIVLERDRDEPVPSAAPAPDPVPIEAPTPAAAAEQKPKTSPARPEADEAETVAAEVVAEPESAPPAEQERRPAPEAAPAAAAGGLWAVQLGSFSNRENAEKLASDLRGEGYAAFLSRLEANGAELHRVRVGPQKDRGAAESVAATLADSGHKGQVVTHP